MMNEKFLVETALLGQGLRSCDNAAVHRIWCSALPADLAVLVWLWQGKITVGTIDEFLVVRQAENMGRYNHYNLNAAAAAGDSGFLTAGGTMQAAAAMGVKYVVSCGLGGIDSAGVSSDYPALCEFDVVLLATAVKDMFAVQPVLDYLHQRGGKACGVESCAADGYLFRGEAVALDGVVGGDSPAALPTECKLVLNSIPDDCRLDDRKILAAAVQAGREAAAKGEMFHPAVNGRLDELSGGKTSEVQLKSLVENISLLLKL